MGFEFACDHCGQVIVVKYLKEGETATCTSCGCETIVPAGAKTVDGSIMDTSGTPVSPIEKPEIQRSDGVAGVLLVLLWVGLGVFAAMLGLVIYLKDSMAPITHSTEGWTLLGLVLLSGPVVIGQTAAYLVWIARLHGELGRFYPGYRITPGQAVARILIPVYHLWGTWSVYSTMSRRFGDNKDRPNPGGSLLPVLTVLLVLSLALDYVLFAGTLASGMGDTLGYSGMFSSGEVFGFAVSFVTGILYIVITVHVRGIIREKYRALD